MKKLFLLLTVWCLILPLHGQIGQIAILPMKERAQVIDEILSDRIQTLLPEIMRREGIDMWVVISREYNEDPVIKTMLPSTWLAARRRTILVMFDQGQEKGIEALAVARYDVGTTFKKAWDQVAAEMSAKDPDFKRAWASLSAFRDRYKIWDDLALVD